jgi:hypothetical protein
MLFLQVLEGDEVLTSFVPNPETTIGDMIAAEKLLNKMARDQLKFSVRPVWEKDHG